jgi:hypothetical protein
MRRVDREAAFMSASGPGVNQTTAAAERNHTPRLKRSWIAATLSLAVAAVYLLRLDGVFGLWKDDGWYLTLAKSLATGHGYRLINFADQAGVYYYPPGFPILLSLLYRLYPHFPENVWLLKSLSLLAMATMGWLFYKLLRQSERLPADMASLVAICTVAAPCLVFMATSSLMSESLFAALQMGALFVAEKYIRRRELRFGRVLLMALLASLALMVRSFGVVLVAAIVIYLLKERLFRPMIIFVVAVGMLSLPWTIYKGQLEQRTSPQAQSRLPGPYSQQFLERTGGSGAKMPVSDLPQRVWQNITAIAGADAGGIFVPSAFRQPNESGEETIDMTLVVTSIGRDIQGSGKGTMGNALATKLISLALFLVVVAGFISAARRGITLMEILIIVYLTLVISWGGPPLRYLLPVVPFLFFYLTFGCQSICEAISRLAHAPSFDCQQPARVLLLCILGLYFYDHAGYIIAKQLPVAESRHPDWLHRFDANRRAALWIRGHTAKDEVVTGDNVTLLYLTADRTTDKCEVAECAKRGIRYYLKSEDGADFKKDQIRFDSGYPYVQVAEIGPTK